MLKFYSRNCLKALSYLKKSSIKGETINFQQKLFKLNVHNFSEHIDIQENRQQTEGQRREILCYNCQKKGHLSRDCTEPRREREIKCFNCGEVGHKNTECSKPKKERDISTVTCYNCGKTGHTKSQCTEPPKEKKTSAITCFNCGEKGHKNTECPQPRKPREETGHLRPRDYSRSPRIRKTSEDFNPSKEGNQEKQFRRVCFKCQEEGHLSSECKNEITCRLCRGKGHYAKNCTMNDKRNNAL